MTQVCSERSGLSVIISTLDEGEELHATLRSLFSCAQPPEEVIVVDDGGGDGSCAALSHEEWQSFPLKVASIARRGIAGARNFGRSLARMPRIAFVDAHCRLEGGALSALRAALDQRPNAVLAAAIRDRGGAVFGCGAELIGPELRTRWLPPDTAAGELRPVPIAPGGCLAMETRVFDALGGFDDLRELGLEDVEFSLHAWRMGFEVLGVPRARLEHSFRSTPHYQLRSTSRGYNLARIALVHFDGIRRDSSLRSLIGLPRASEILLDALVSDWEQRRVMIGARCGRSAEEVFRLLRTDELMSLRGGMMPSADTSGNVA
jgi:glycosyltransferase involved in cell wall biosynthesis